MTSNLLILPVIWATEDVAYVEFAINREVASPPVAAKRRLRNELTVYRRYTEAILRRYLKMSMEAGRAPSLLGREMFRGKVTSYRVHSFEDVVIFVHDVEACLKRLDEDLQQILFRIALQEYTFQEAADLMHLPLRTIVRRYAKALDGLTPFLLKSALLEKIPSKSCQGPFMVDFPASA